MIMMAKVHPKTSMITTCCQYSSSKREIFTVWMKSLVINGNGYTVFNSKGEIVFRVDNYQTRHSSQVLLMNFNGEVLFSIKRKKLLVFGNWEVRKVINSELYEEGEWFKVIRKCRLLGRDVTCHVCLGSCNNKTKEICYQIAGFRGKSSIKIMDKDGRVLAEMMQKQSSTGVCLGDDVLTLMVEPQINQSLIMALVIVYGMINNQQQYVNI